MMSTAWGKHMILDARQCYLPLILCPNNVAAFAQTLVKRIDMVPFGEPWVRRFGTGDKAGITLVQLIETSNITAHFCDETGDAYVDVFSCKDFHDGVVERTVREYFRPLDIRTQTIFRGTRTDSAQLK